MTTVRSVYCLKRNERCPPSDCNSKSYNAAIRDQYYAIKDPIDTYGW